MRPATAPPGSDVLITRLGVPDQGRVAPPVGNRGEPALDADADADLDGAFTALYRGTYPRLVRALELGGSSRAVAEDVAQEAFARTLVHWWRVRRGESPAGYVYRVAFRLARRGGPHGAELAGEASVPDVAGSVAAGVDLERTLRAMPPARRRCAVLCLVAGLSTKDAARTLRIAESTVRKQLERARADLRVGLGTAEPDAQACPGSEER